MIIDTITEKGAKTVKIEFQQQEVLELISRLANAAAAFERNGIASPVSFPAVLIEDHGSLGIPSALIFKIEGQEQLKDVVPKKNSHIKKYKKHFEEENPEDT